MAVIDPAVRGDTGFIDPRLGLLGGQLATTEVLTTDGAARSNRKSLAIHIHYFASVDNDDTWDDAPPGLVAAFWGADDVDTDYCSVYVSGDKQVTFETSGTGVSGFVLTFSARTS